ncbi:EAL domain-containing protein [Actimicrobium sp. CCC2.4]|uniref:EAL domain-containing protein n=1 Tax=Actimicrobium sp. CCC2.4 TaxID=3048606 RepID=UPI002AC90E4F|nr:EAL domain-containing protein [Actimicrobium sp. CCC2.4]MEB0134504.1 EAL domain-containing protein [Actimicrobium sp. CCC2.4]WPX33135.1 EAL domain-containing protein [Actimicrobium sp. CCC2.4]
MKLDLHSWRTRLGAALSLRIRIVAAVLLTMLAATVTVMLVSLSLGRQEMKEIITTEQGALLTRTADQIDQKFERRLASLALLAKKIAQTNAAGPQALQHYLEDQSELLVWFDNLLVAGIDGAVLANMHYPASRSGVSLTGRDYFQDTLSLRTGVISRPVSSVITNRPVILITAPVFDSSGKMVMVLIGTIELAKDNFVASLGKAHIGKSGYFFIMTSDGVFVSHPDTTRILQPAHPFLAASPALVRAMEGFEGTIESPDSLGAPSLFSFRRLYSTSWIVASVQPAREAFSTIDRAERRSLLFVLLLALCVGPLAWWAIDRQLRPLDQLAGRIDAVRQRPSLVMLPVVYAATEFGRLAQSFDELMRERLLADSRYQRSAEELRAATDSKLDAFFVLQAERNAAGEVIDFRFSYINDIGLRLLGLAREQVIGQGLCELLPVNRTDGFFDRYVQVLQSGIPLKEEFAIDTPGIHATWLAHQVTPLADGVAITSRDISQRKRDELELSTNRTFLQSLIDHLPVIVYSKSMQAPTYGQFVLWNKAAERLTGLTAAVVIGKTSGELFAPDSAAVYDEHDRKIMARRTSIGIPGHPMRALDGTVRMLRTHSLPVFDAAGEVDFILGISEDITELHAEQLALEASEERLRVTLNSIGDAVITTDMQARVTYLNPVAERMTGWLLSNATGRPLTEVFRIYAGDDDVPLSDPVAGVIATGVASSTPGSAMLAGPGGARAAIEDMASPIRDAGDAMLGVVLVFHDVSQAHRMAEQMTHLAAHDALTGLLNRREFERRLEQAVASATRDGMEHTVMYLDLDQFKIVNDTCGHVAGDELLRQLTTLLHAKLRQSDTLARLGGDEFGVLLEHCGTVPALRVAEQLRQTVSDFHFVWLDKSFPIGVSIGLVTFGAGITTPDILRMADSACYVAKDKGRNRVHVYSEENAELVHRQGQMSWVTRLRQALDEDRFVLFCQPIMALGQRQGSHEELLLRLRADDGSLIPPMAFIPAAERYGLMPALDRWVIRRALATHALRHPPGGAPALVAINLSATSICDETFLPFVLAQFALTGVAPSEICFEVTETAAIANLGEATILMRALKAIGCKFSLDDFGSGMSSFTYLKHLPVDYLKIDGSFVKDMIDDPVDRAMVEAIHRIGHVMGLQTIAEFVESEAIIAALREIGVDHAQGYAIGKPVQCDVS